MLNFLVGEIVPFEEPVKLVIFHLFHISHAPPATRLAEDQECKQVRNEFQARIRRRPYRRRWPVTRFNGKRAPVRPGADSVQAVVSAALMRSVGPGAL
jgi:hypothetical protein